MALPEGCGSDGGASLLREAVDGLMAKYDRSVGDGARDACRRDLVRDLLLEAAAAAARRAADLRVLADTGALLEGQLRIEDQLSQMQLGLLESGSVRSRSLEEHPRRSHRMRSRLGLGCDDVAEPSSLEEVYHRARSEFGPARLGGAGPPSPEEQRHSTTSKFGLAREDGRWAPREEPEEPSTEAAAGQSSYSMGGVQTSGDEQAAEAAEAAEAEEDVEVRPALAGTRSSSVKKRVSIASSNATRRQSWRESIELKPELQGNDEQLEQICREGIASVTLRSARALSMSSAAGHRARSMRRQHSVSASRTSFWVMAPASPQRLLVDLFSIAVLCYDAVSLPYQLAWEVPQEGMWLYLACASCCYWVFDLLAYFRTGFYKNGNLVMEPAKIARQYLRRTFLLDFVTIIADMVALFLQLLDIRAGGWPSVVRLARILKIGRVARLISIMRTWSLAQVFDRLYRCSAVFHASAKFMLDTMGFAAVILWLNHVLACTWFALGTRDDRDTEITWLNTDVGNGRTYADESPRYQYVTCLHWSITQMTPGSMQVFAVNSEERQFNILCLMAGLVIFSFLISSITAAVTQFKVRVHQHTEKLDAVRRFLREARVSSTLALAVNKQVVQKLNTRRPLTAKDVDVMNLLSLSIQRDLMMELCFPVLGTHAFFRFVLEMDRSVAEELCRSCSEFVTIARTDTLFLSGGDALGMYFVTSGELTYTLMQDRMMTSSPTKPRSRWSPTLVVERGEWLCEAALWCRWRHTGNAENTKASFCELLLVRSEQLLQVVKRQTLMSSLVWAYARGFCALLQDSKPPGCAWPNDVKTQFGADEVLLSMPHSAKEYLGQFTINFMLMSRGWLGSWFSYEGQVEALQSEVYRGKSFLMISMNRPKGERVLRVVSLVALRLQREDGRYLARLGLETRPEGHVEATCKFPGAASHAGESRDMVVKRLLEQQLEPVKDQIRIENYERTDETKRSDRLRVQTRYIKVIVHATWFEEEDAMTFDGSQMLPAPSYDVSGSRSLPTGSVVTAEARSAAASSELSRVPSKLLRAPVFKIMDGYFAWLYEEEVAHYSRPAGQAELREWLSGVPHMSTSEGLHTAPSAPA